MDRSGAPCSEAGYSTVELAGIFSSPFAPAHDYPTLLPRWTFLGLSSQVNTQLAWVHVTPASVEPIPTPLTPRRVYLARHGATAWSKSGRHTGRSDLPLQPSGETEARSLAGKLKAVLPATEPAVVLSSPLQRALQTCRLAGYGEVAVLDDGLVEWDYGDYEGLTTEQIRRVRPGWDLFRDGCPNGEQLSDVEGRVRVVLSRLGGDATLAGRSALLFAHGHLLRVLAAVWCDFGGESARSLPLETAALGVLGWSHEVRALEGWNL